MVKRAEAFVALLLACCFSASRVVGFVPPQQHRAFVSSTHLYAEEQEEKKNKVLDFLMNPYESNIPKEMEAEIYRAEGNTVAAQERSKRVTLYAVVAFTLVACAFFNGFLTELRKSDIMDGTEASMSLADLGFGWVQANFLFRFLFLNKIGGGLALVLGAGTGMLAEAELDSRRKNAERIWEELERRRNEGAPTKKKKTAAAQQQPRRKRKSGKQAKRLGALSEVVLDDSSKQDAAPPVEEPKPVAEKKEEGMMDKLKGWYDKADSMAASQALLLNKKLEDEGILEKVTDETGLKVIGKDAAAKLKTEKDATGAVSEAAKKPTSDENNQAKK